MIISTNITFLSELETIQNTFGRFLLGGNKLRPFIDCQGNVRWSKFEDRDALISKLKYLVDWFGRIAKALHNQDFISPLASKWDELAEYYDSEITARITTKAEWDWLMLNSVNFVAADIFNETVQCLNHFNCL